MRKLEAADAIIVGIETKDRQRELLDEAVKSHLVSDVPLGVFLSGGIDSGSIVALMAAHSTGAVETFSIAA